MSEKKIKESELPTCGIIMPISSIDSCSAEHWADVLGIIKDVCEKNGFKPNLVSDSDDIGVIQNRIVENIYSSDIVICDVSCKNANVMFELGMRLAFDKPTILIKDDMTGYSFDTSVIEHIEYPRDLRFTTINKFKDYLGKKLIATHEKAKDPNFSTFLKNFGKYKIAHLEDREITSDNFILNAIEELRRDVRTIKTISINEREEYRSPGKKMTFGEAAASKGLFLAAVNNYFTKNKINDSPENLELLLPEIVSELEKNSTLRNYCRSSSDFEKNVREALYLL